jgi:hypothetical protein
MVMEYLGWANLADAVRARPDARRSQLFVADQVLAALSFMHEKGDPPASRRQHHAHPRGVGPREAKLIDLGIARSSTPARS